MQAHRRRRRPSAGTLGIFKQIKPKFLIGDFINLALRCTRAEIHLASFDLKSMESTWQTYRAQFERLPEGDKRRAVEVPAAA